MNIIVYTQEKAELYVLIDHITQYCTARNIPVHIDHCKNWPDLAQSLQQSRTDVVLVAQNGVRGLDTVTGAQPLAPDIIGISDLDFAAQSYRMGITYFCMKPISYSKVERAMDRCMESFGQRPTVPHGGE